MAQELIAITGNVPRHQGPVNWHTGIGVACPHSGGGPDSGQRYSNAGEESRMTVPAELRTLHRAVEQLRSCVGDVRSRYGDIPHVRRLVGDVDRIDIDVSELDVVPPPAAAAMRAPLERIDDTPSDPAMWAGADDEGLGGYHGGRDR